MSTATIHRLTADEYLALERVAESKSEFFEGEMIPMPGGSAVHSLIAMNFGSELRRVLRGKGYRVYTSDLRVMTPEGLYTYPDVSVVGDTPRFDDDQQDILLNPVLLVEVLSPSSEANDRGAKFARYREIESLRTYVLLSQDSANVEVFSRQPDDSWSLRTFRSGNVTIHDPAGKVEIAEIYDQVNLNLKGTR